MYTIKADYKRFNFSATQTKKTEDLARISLKKMPVYIGVDDLKDTATSDMLEQGYIITESDLRLRVLYTFLKKNKSKKIMVFFSSCMSVKYHYEVFFYFFYPGKVLSKFFSWSEPEIAIFSLTKNLYTLLLVMGKVLLISFTIPKWMCVGCV